MRLAIMAAATGWRAGDGAADGFLVPALARLSGFPAMGFPLSLLLGCFFPGRAPPSGVIARMTKVATSDFGQ
jgi:hypothetical protein